MLNPQSAEAQQLVVNQVAEILERYPVDGIHFDDYFFVDGMQDALPQEEKMRSNRNVQTVSSESVRQEIRIMHEVRGQILIRGFHRKDMWIM